MSDWSKKLSCSGCPDTGGDQWLPPVFGRVEPTLSGWQQRRGILLSRLQEILGHHSMPEFDHTGELIRKFDLPDAQVEEFRLPTGPSTRQQVLLLRPKTMVRQPCPAAVVPFYNPADMAGYDPVSLQPKERPLIHFGRHLVQQGYTVLCTQAFPYNTVPEPKSTETFEWWREAAGKVLNDNPRWTGMGKLVWDMRIGTDFLLQQPGIDADRIVCMGHSLGGKIAFYSGALDERIKAVIASDFGIGFPFSNWEDPWYLGTKVLDAERDIGHHALLALIAPRPFLLIAGQYDKRESRQYLKEAAKVYALYGREHAVGMFDHATGHTPNEESLRIAYEWLAEQFNLPVLPWVL